MAGRRKGSPNLSTKTIRKRIEVLMQQRFSDGDLNGLDRIILAQAAAATIPDEDGKVNTQAARFVLEYAVGKPKEFVGVSQEPDEEGNRPAVVMAPAFQAIIDKQRGKSNGKSVEHSGSNGKAGSS